MNIENPVAGISLSIIVMPKWINCQCILSFYLEHPVILTVLKVRELNQGNMTYNIYQRKRTNM